MRARTLLILVALVLLTLPALAEKASEENVKVPEVTAKAPQVGVENESPRQEVQPTDELPGFGLEKTFKTPEEQTLCPICPLSFCAGLYKRCDYTGCTSRCCTYTCYYDPSCSSGACYTYACRCPLILPQP